MMQMRAYLGISLTRGSLALPLPALFTLLRCIAHVCCIVRTRFALSSIYTENNLASLQVEPTFKPWLDLARGKPGLGRFTFANLGAPGANLGWFVQCKLAIRMMQASSRTSFLAI